MNTPTPISCLLAHAHTHTLTHATHMHTNKQTHTETDMDGHTYAHMCIHHAHNYTLVGMVTSLKDQLYRIGSVSGITVCPFLVAYRFAKVHFGW